MFALVKFYEKDFVNEYGDLKKAYLNSCKWVSSKVMSKNIDKVVWKTIKSSETTITLQLFFTLDVNDEKREHCKACKEFHKSFFINEELYLQFLLFFPCSNKNFLYIHKFFS